ncbi:MAG: hypothetical protein R3305_10345 [Gammaproteobacteria bacterium]|nr:hypothetical protein [Gammaproteobacteria bacterium]
MEKQREARLTQLVAAVDALPEEHRRRIAALIQLLLNASQPAADRAQQLIWSAIGASQESAVECIDRVDSAIEYLTAQSALSHPNSKRPRLNS